MPIHLPFSTPQLLAATLARAAYTHGGGIILSNDDT